MTFFKEGDLVRVASSLNHPNPWEPDLQLYGTIGRVVENQASDQTVVIRWPQIGLLYHKPSHIVLDAPPSDREDQEVTIKVGDRVRFKADPKHNSDTKRRFEDRVLGTVVHISPPLGRAKPLAHVEWDDEHREDLEPRDYPGYYFYRFVVIDFEEETEDPKVREVLDQLVDQYESRRESARIRANTEQQIIDRATRRRDEATSEVKAYTLAIEKLEKK